jgi:site-specific recombinase XerD
MKEEAYTLLEQYLDYLEIEKNRSRKTRENYSRYLLAFFEDQKIRKLSHITPEKVRNFRVHLSGKELKKNTQGYYVIAIRNFLKYLIKQGYETLPPERIELPKTSRRDIEVLDYRELERLIGAPEGETLRALRDKAILETFFSTGLRLSELCSLKRYIDLERGEVSVRGKGDKLRVVFLSEGARKAIRKYLDKRTDPEEALFVSLSRSGNVIGRITPRSVERLVDFYARAAGIPKKIHPHQLRHSFATDLLINGADLRSVQSLLGHANVSTTQIYTHLTNKELRDIHKAFHGRRRKK